MSKLRTDSLANLDGTVDLPLEGFLERSNQTGTQPASTISDLGEVSGLVFGTVAEMRAAQDLQVGFTVRTLGYHSPGDGGGNDYEIVAAGTGVDDGGSFIGLPGSGLQARATFLDTIHATAYGIRATADDVTLNQYTDFESLINKLNSDGVPRKVIFPQGKITIAETKLPDITVPVSFIGQGRSQTRLYFQNCSGLTFDMTDWPTQRAAVEVRDMSLSLNSNTAEEKVGIRYIGTAVTTTGSDTKLKVSGVFLGPETRFRDRPSGHEREWDVAISIGDGVTQSSEILIEDVQIYGSNYNANYSTVTSSIGILANKVTGLRLDLCKIVQCYSGIKVIGQSEGLIVNAGTIVACVNGVEIVEQVNPSNNHVISDTHISAHERGVLIGDQESMSWVSTAHMFSNMFILERDPGTTKTNGFVGIDAYVGESAISNVAVHSNTTGGEHSRTAFKLTGSSNKVVNSEAWNQDYFAEDLAFNNNGARTLISNCAAHGNIVAEPSSSDSDPLIFVCFNSGGANDALLNKSSVYRFHGRDGDRLLDMNPGGVFFGGRNRTVYPLNLQSSNGDSLGWDTRLLSVGGDAGDGVDGNGVLRIDSNVAETTGTLRPATDNSVNLGTGSLRFAQVFAASGTINTSDEREKDFSDLSDAELAVAKDLRGCIRKFKWKDAVASKGEESARWHFGVGAQSVAEVFEKHGLDPLEYGVICYDEWDESPELTDENGDTIREYRAAGNRYGVRYNELIAFMLTSL